MINYKSQAVYITVGNVVYLFGLWLLTVITTRLKGYYDAGIFALATSISALSVAFQLYGVRAFQVSDCDNEFWANDYERARWITAESGFLLCAFALPILGYSGIKGFCILALVFYRSCEAVSDVYQGELQIVGRLDVAAMSLAGKSLLSVGCFWSVLAVTKSLPLAFVAICAVSLLFVIVDKFCFNRLVIARKCCSSFAKVWKLLAKCLPLMIATILPIVITTLPRIALDKYCGTELLGYYGNLSNPTVFLITLIACVQTAVMPLYGKFVQEGQFEKLGRCLLGSFAGTVCFGLFCAAAVFVAGDIVMSLIFTDKILPYVKFLYPLILSMTIYGLTMCANAVLISLRKNLSVTLLVFISLVVCCIICDSLVKQFAIAGAIAVLVISYFVQFVLQCAYIFWTLKDRCGRETHAGK